MEKKSTHLDKGTTGRIFSADFYTKDYRQFTIKFYTFDELQKVCQIIEELIFPEIKPE